MKRWFISVSAIVAVVTLGALAAAGTEEKDPAGKTLFLKYKCQNCHSVTAVGIERKAAADAEESGATASKKKVVDLSSTGLDVKADWLPKYLKKLDTTAEGKKHVTSFKGTDAELTTLTTWLMEQKAPKPKAEGGAKPAE